MADGLDACGVPQPGRRAPAPGKIFLGTSRGVCRECRRSVDVRTVADEQGVWLERLCPEHGPSRALIAESLAWYLEALQLPPAARPPAQVLRAHQAECPRSCGPCGLHAQACHLPVFSVTNACDLRCPICFTYNRADQRWFMSREEFARHVDFVVEATGGVDLINLTGGEPTLHPQLCELLQEARRPEIGRITVNTNGLTLARDPDLARRLADLGVYVILSLDSLDPQLCVRLHGRDISGEKQKALENLERAGVQTTLLMVLVGGVNEGDLPAVLDLALRRPFVRSLTIQTMTYTGQGGGNFLPRRHIPVEGVERRIEEASQGRIRRSDFVPLPTAHPLCYGVTYLLLDDAGEVHPLSHLLDRQTLAGQLASGYLLQPGPALEQQLRAGIDRLWSEGSQPGLLKAMRGLLSALYPPGETLSVHERQRRAEQRVKTIYAHAHMDEDTFEVGRAMRCPDQVPVPTRHLPAGASGCTGEYALVGACAYNLFYRMADERFWVSSDEQR